MRHGLIGFFLFFLALQAAGPAFSQAQNQATARASEPELWAQYRTYRSDEKLEKAEKAARQLLELTLAEHGEDSVETGMALTELGITRLLMGHHEQALSDLRLAEDTLRERVPLYSEKLIGALTFLGSALQNLGRHEPALDTFTRAQHITHRLLGTENIDQVRIVYAKADSYQALGQLDQAADLQAHALKLHRAHFGDRAPETVAASARFGTWLRAIGDYHGAINHFHQALVDLQGDGPDLPVAYPLLKAQAHAYQGGYRGKYARSGYQRVIDLMAAHPEAFDLDQRIRAHLDLGNWLMQRYYEKRAVRQYEAAWELAAQAGPEGEKWIERFSKPKMVRYGEMTPHDFSGANQAVQFEFNLTADGRARRVKLVSHAEDKKESARARKHFPDLVRYRPALVDGRAVPVKGVAATMYLLPENVSLEPAPFEAPRRMAERVADLNPAAPLLDKP